MNRVLTIIPFLMMCIEPMLVCAQWSFDIPSVEAYIADHKAQSSLLIARATLEQSNKLLHQYSAQATADYKDISFDLDKYTRAFDVIDVLYQSLRTSMNVYQAYRRTTSRIGDYGKLLSDYKDKVVEKRGISLSDTIVLTVAARTIGYVAAETEQLYHSVSDLVLYVTGAAECSTASLLFVLGSIDASLTRILTIIDRAYIDTWRHIQLRMGYWKELYRTKRARHELIEDAFGRWRDSSHMSHRQ